MSESWDDRVHFFTFPLRVLEHSDIEPDTIRVLNAGGQTALVVPRQPGVLDKLACLVYAANELNSADTAAASHTSSTTADSDQGMRQGGADDAR